MTTMNIILLLLILNLLLLLYNTFKKLSPPKDSTHDNYDGEVPEGNVGRRINLDRAMEIISNYEPRRIKHTELLSGEERRSKGDTRSTFVDINAAHRYLRYVEKKSKSKGIPVNGLRFYFGAYPENDAKEERGMQTLVVFPTTKDGEVDFRGIDLERSESNNLFKVSDGLKNHREMNKLEEVKEVNENPKFQLMQMGFGDSSAGNDMGGSPPRQPTDE